FSRCVLVFWKNAARHIDQQRRRFFDVSACRSKRRNRDRRRFRKPRVYPHFIRHKRRPTHRSTEKNKRSFNITPPLFWGFFDFYGVPCRRAIRSNLLLKVFVFLKHEESQ